MPIFIHGWLEITGTHGPDQAESWAWRGVVNVGNVLIDEADAIAEHLFGFSKRAISAGDVGLVGGRGIPGNLSAEARAELAAEIDALGAGQSVESGGHTSAAWHEVASVGLPEEELAVSRWRTVFALAGVLVREGGLSPSQVRLVVWYSW